MKKFLLCVISDLRCEVVKTALFWVITQHVVIVTNVSGQPIGPTFKGPEYKNKAGFYFN